MGKRTIRKEYIIYLKVVMVVVVLWSMIIWMLFEGFHRSRDIYLTAEQDALQAKVSATLKTYEVFSNYIFEEIVANDEVLSLMHRANHANEEEKVVIREELHDLLAYDYATISRYDFRQLHFHLPNSESFLRMHSPSKFGDSLLGIRETVRIANEEEIYVFGFEEGRIYNGYRFVYPLTYNYEHVGSVEVSLSMATLMEVLDQQYPDMDTYFLISEETVKTKVFDDQLDNYIDAEFFEGYFYDREVYEVSLRKNNLLGEEKSQIVFRETSKLFEEFQRAKSNFSIQYKLNGKDYLLQFLSIDNISGDTVGYFLGIGENTSLVVEKKDFYIESGLVTLLLLLFLVASWLYIRYQIHITEISLRDNLTGLYNRYKFNDFAESELQRCKRYGGEFSILMIDIDFFKKVNDTYGHLRGDMVLKELADLLMETLRVNDLVARWGGEEFICCLPNTNRDQVVIVAEKIRKQVEDHIFEEVGHITISIGGTLVTPEDNKLDGPIGRADNGLYESKNNGRNRSTIV